ncbi:MAG: winged helix-turn-helix transcriptional regulator [Alteromonadaceae bacterium]|nr:winged helix-turn-helix transcriptional regulator [Alteromonadaceae bacterium]
MNLRQTYRLGNFRVEPLECALYHPQHGKQSLQPKFIDVLNYLVQQYPKVVSRQELIEQVWQGNEYVGEKALTNAVWHLRQALKADNSDEVIETIRKTGYRLLLAPDVDAAGTPETEPLSPSGFLLARYNILVASLVMLIIALLVYTNWPSPAPSSKLPITVTTEPGLELFPAPSPDGRYIVYKWLGQGGQADLFKRDLQQPELGAIRLTFDQAYEGHSVWSNDGRYLYFSRKDREIDQCDVVRMDMQSFQETFVTQCPTFGGYHYIDISPDDKTLAFYGDEDGATRSGIYTLDLTDKSATPKRFSCDQDCSHKERDMAFSPDGRYMAVTRRFNSFNENIFLVELTSGETHQLTFNEEDIVGLSWHPDGTKLVYGVQRADTRTGYLLDVDTMQRQPLSIEGLSYPNFARKTPLLFFQYRKEQYQIAAWPLDQEVNSSPFPVLQSGYNHKSPDYHETLQRIAYLSNETGHYEIWTADSDGSNRKQLTHLGRSSRYPKWSHDGQYIAFLAPDEDGDGDHVYLVEAATKRVQQLSSPFNSHNRPFWSPDDSAILTTVFTPQHSDIYRFSLSGASPERLTHNRGRYGVMPDEHTLIYSTWRRGLWKLSLHTGETVELLNSDTFPHRYAWTATTEGIYYLVEEDQYQELHFYNFANQEHAVLLRTPRSTFVGDGDLRLDMGERRILFTKTLFNQSDIKYVTVDE